MMRTIANALKKETSPVFARRFRQRLDPARGCIIERLPGEPAFPLRSRSMNRSFLALCLVSPVFLGLAPCRVRADDAKPASPEVQAITDITYRGLYEGEDAKKAKNKLDVYVPRGRKDFPVVFFVHGGAWRNGDKNFFGVYGNLGMFLARQGIGAVITNYRLS